MIYIIGIIIIVIEAIWIIGGLKIRKNIARIAEDLIKMRKEMREEVYEINKQDLDGEK